MAEQIKYTIYIDNVLVSEDQTDTAYSISSLTLGEHNIKITGKCQHAVVKSAELTFDHSLPAYTLRFKFSKDSTDPTTLSMEKGTWTKVTSSTDNIWDFTYNNSDWSNLFNGILTAKFDPDIKVIASGDTSSVTTMAMLFNYCKGLTSLNLSNFDTSNVINMNAMFNECSNLTSLDISNFNTSKVRGMSSMFDKCAGLTELDISSFDTSNVTVIQAMFNNCTGLTELDVSNIDLSKVTSISRMFSGCVGLTSLDLSSFNTSNITDMSYLFEGCKGLTSLDLSNFDTSSVTTMANMFSRCTGLTSLGLSSFDISKVTDMSKMFWDCNKLASGMLAFYQAATDSSRTTAVTNYGNCFTGCGTQGGDAALAERAHIPTTWGGDGAEMTITATPTVNGLTATINYTIANGNYDTWTVTCNGQTATGTTGSFEFTDLAPNTYNYTVTAKCGHNIEITTEVSFTIEEPHTDFEIVINDYTPGDDEITWEATY